MTVAQKRWLSATGAVQTQALLGTRVSVLDTSGIWTNIAVSTQSTPKDGLGYPGWVPTRQLTMTQPRQSARIAVVRARTAWLWNHWSVGGVGGAPVLEVSYDTRLPVVKVAPNYVEVVTMTGRHRAIRRSLVAVHTLGTPWQPSASQVMTEARHLVGLKYLWGGASGFGYDCSGFTYSLYHRVGKAIPRDASAQATQGTAVSLTALRPGDLLFVAGSSGAVVHVVMYDGVVAGRRSIIESPHTGASIRVMPLTTYSYVGARRYLGS